MSARMLMIALAAALLAPSASAQGESPEKEACRKQEREQGAGEIAAKVKCAVKTVFQSRVRRKSDEEPVEMTVGSPPMQTEDTDTPGDGNWEVNLGLEAEWSRGDRRVEAPTLDLNYGVGERIQLTYEVPYVFLRDDGDDDEPQVREQGVGDSGIGLKYRFYDNEERGLSLALYPQLRFHTPGANRAVSEGGTTFSLPLVMVSEFEHCSVSADLGIEVGSGERRWFGGAGIGWRFDDRTALMAELAGNDLNSNERTWTAGFGLRRKIDDKHTLSASIGRDVVVGDGESRQNHFAAAWQMEFGD